MRKVSEMDNMAANDERLGNEGPEARGDIQGDRRCQHYGRRGVRGPSGATLERVGSLYTPYMEDRLCRKLKYFFMGPDEKIKAKRKCPWKLCSQVLKIVIVTAQLIQFGTTRSNFVEYTERSTVAMKHLFLKDWDNSYETMPYPAAVGPYAVYKIDELIKHVDFALNQYKNIEDIAIGSLHWIHHNHTELPEPIVLCLQHYKTGDIFENDTYSIDSHVITDCFPLWPRPDGCECDNFTQCMRKCEHNKTLHADRLLVLSLKFSLKDYHLDMKERNYPPQCYKIDTEVTFDDGNKDGQMMVGLQTTLSEITLKGKFSNEDAEKRMRIGLIIFDVIVILIAFLSAVLCSRSLLRGEKLRRETVTFFKHRFGKSMSLSDNMEFLNLWYVTIIINDVLTMVGSGLKIQLENRNLQSSSDNYDICGSMLGTGSLLAWLGVLRYIGFFRQFNILILTLKKAFPNMMRFLVCSLMLYIGFTICGWIVLGPYHIKFRSLSSSSECLFSLINGDDMFVTFSATVTTDQLVWYYSRFYLYIFISLFIYAVLNLFIAVILDTYETLKDYYENGFPKSDLFKFIDQCTDPAHSPIYRSEDSSCNPVSMLCCCCNRSNPDEPDEYTRLTASM